MALPLLLLHFQNLAVGTPPPQLVFCRLGVLGLDDDVADDPAALVYLDIWGHNTDFLKKPGDATQVFRR